jgi:hypothetical protein
MPKPDELRAEPARPPHPSPALETARAERAEHLSRRSTLERRSVARGLILLAVAALVFSIWRAGLDRVFVPGWWRQW